MATLIVVRRDAGEIFERLQTTIAREPGSGVELVWDRRTADRRRLTGSIPVDRRVQDRREPEADAGFLDQRRGERRERPEARMPERRQAERRRRPPDTWGTLGFVMVRGEAAQPARGEGVE